MLTQLEYHYGDNVFVLDIVIVKDEEQIDSKGEPLRWFVPRIWRDSVNSGSLLNASDLKYFPSFDDAAIEGERWMKDYNKKNA